MQSNIEKHGALFLHKVSIKTNRAYNLVYFLLQQVGSKDWNFGYFNSYLSIYIKYIFLII